MAVQQKNGLVNQPQQSPGNTNVHRIGIANLDSQGFDNGGGKTQVDSGSQSRAAYRGDLQTNFQGAYDYDSQQYNSYANDTDADVRTAQNLTNILSEAQHPDFMGQTSQNARGVDQVAIKAQLDAVKARLGLKNSLGQAIGSNQQREGEAEDILKGNANEALGEGVRHTRENYNGRGLLYSGMREGGEQGVRNSVASNLASGLAGTKREYANLADQQKAAYAAIGQAQQKEIVDRANQTFDTVSRNNVARQQAYQQLAGGLGELGGQAYSSYKNSGSSYDNMNPNANNYERLPSRQGLVLNADNNDYQGQAG